MSCIKPSVAYLPAYRVLQDQTVVKLNQNESPFDIPPHVKARILERLQAKAWNRYPDVHNPSLLNALADYTGHSPDGIVLGNGSNEIIQSVFTAACGAGDRAVMVKPDFAMYARVATVLGVDVVEVPLLPSFEFDVPALIKAAKDARLVIIASPNVPTGIPVEPTVLEYIASQCRGMFVVDEAYFEFSGVTALTLLQKFESMVIIRTLSKACSLAGARLGYALASPGLARGIEKAKLPFSVGLFQQCAGEVLLRERNFITSVAHNVTAERTRLFDALKKIPGVTPVPSTANFILVKIEGHEAGHVFSALYEHGILVRNFDVPPLRSTVRVTIGAPESNQRFIDALRTIMEQQEGRGS